MSHTLMKPLPSPVTRYELYGGSADTLAVAFVAGAALDAALVASEPVVGSTVALVLSRCAALQCSCECAWYELTKSGYRVSNGRNLSGGRRPPSPLLPLCAAVVLLLLSRGEASAVRLCSVAVMLRLCPLRCSPLSLCSSSLSLSVTKPAPNSLLSLSFVASVLSPCSWRRWRSCCRRRRRLPLLESATASAPAIVESTCFRAAATSGSPTPTETFIAVTGTGSWYSTPSNVRSVGAPLPPKCVTACACAWWVNFSINRRPRLSVQKRRKPSAEAEMSTPSSGTTWSAVTGRSGGGTSNSNRGHGRRRASG